MNAYELADECEKYAVKDDINDFNKKVTAKLRQQAKRIEELEKKLSLKTVAEVIAKHETIASRKQAIDKARAKYAELSDEEILAVAVGELDCVDEEHIKRFARSIIKASRGEE